jgi:hypothetical protein
MSPAERQKWESVRAKGHASFIVRSIVRHGILFAAFVTFGPLAYGAALHKPYIPLALPWPILDISFNFMFTCLGFGYLLGEGGWRKNEKAYRESIG